MSSMGCLHVSHARHAQFSGWAGRGTLSAAVHAYTVFPCPSYVNTNRQISKKAKLAFCVWLMLLLVQTVLLKKWWCIPPIPALSGLRQKNGERIRSQPGLHGENGLDEEGSREKGNGQEEEERRKKKKKSLVYKVDLSKRVNQMSSVSRNRLQRSLMLKTQRGTVTASHQGGGKAYQRVPMGLCIWKVCVPRKPHSLWARRTKELHLVTYWVLLMIKSDPGKQDSSSQTSPKKNCANKTQTTPHRTSNTCKSKFFLYINN